MCVKLFFCLLFISSIDCSILTNTFRNVMAVTDIFCNACTVAIFEGLNVL